VGSHPLDESREALAALADLDRGADLPDRPAEADLLAGRDVARELDPMAIDENGASVEIVA